MKKHKKIVYNYREIADSWKEFLLSKGFTVRCEDYRIDGENYLSFYGCKPHIRIDIYAGYFRTDTKSGGCICSDFLNGFDKVGHCPLYADILVDKDFFWKGIEILMNAGEKWYGSIKLVGGAWVCDPPLDQEKKQSYRNKGY